VPELSERPLRVVLADDSVLLRESMSQALSIAGFEIVGQAGDGEQLLKLVEREEPDVALVDIRMPPTHTEEGIDAAREIRSRHPSTGVLVLSQHLQTAYALKVIEEDAGRIGYLLKDRVSNIEELTDAIRRVADGETLVDPEIVRRLVGRRREHNPLDELTEREREVLSLMAEGRSNKAISQQLFLSERTIEAHVASIFAKLGLAATPDDHRRVLAVVTFLRG
jgi:DNA-binding NarL/FixJ family response regulator